MNADEENPRFTARQVLRRAGAHFWLKAVGATVIMTVFFVGYFAVLRHPLFPVTTVPATWIDALVPLQPWTLIPYFSLWVYVTLPPSWMTDRRELLGFGAGAAALGVVGLGIFLLWPTTIAAPDIDWSRHPSFEFLKSADAAGNACPSLHVAFAVFAALWFARLLPRLGAGRTAQAVNAIWATLIVHSTLATHQHVALDALLGAILGAHAAVWNFAAAPRRYPRDGYTGALWAAVIVIKLCAVLLWTSGVGAGWSLALFFSGGLPVLFHVFAPNAQGLARVFTRFATERREVWLTIDDGPDPDDTPRLLDLLDRHDARATFFLVGNRAARHPGLVAEIVRRGHEIGHHTRTHPRADFWCAGPGRLRRELDAPAALSAATRFRSPVGVKPPGLGRVLRERGLDFIGWSIRSGDSFARDPEAVATRVLRALRPGAIILMHEGPPLKAPVRVAALEQVLAGLAERGYRCVIPAREQLR
ncbi:MAG: polysaccharide deacetylase family protein [Verrucomicrobiota bacterium]